MQEFNDEYQELTARVLANLRKNQVNDQMFAEFEKQFNSTLDHHHIILSRPEKTRMMKSLLKSVLEDMLSRLE